MVQPTAQEIAARVDKATREARSEEQRTEKKKSRKGKRKEKILGGWGSTSVDSFSHSLISYFYISPPSAGVGS